MARLLVVDDEPDLRELLKVSLSLDGHEVLVAADGQSALDMACRERPDALVLDVMMPRLDGWAVLAALKANSDPAVARIPVIMLTARAEDLDLVRGGIEGAVCYRTKPFSLQELHRAVGAAIAGAPEPEQRQAAQKAALSHLARLETGPARAPSSSARPRMSRLEPVTTAHGAAVSRPAGDWPEWLDPNRLSGRDHEILHVLVTSANVSEACDRLRLSRGYLYARLRQLALKLDFPSGPALLQAVRAARAGRRRDR
jgi:DNA-binding response OmpR family regulator